MNRTLIGYALGVAFFLLLVQQGYSLHCWKCNSKFDPRCGESEFDPSTLSAVDCSQTIEAQSLVSQGSEAIYCRKIIQRVQESVRVIRGCGWIEETKAEVGECYTRTGTKDIQITYCHCEKDNCNSATSMAASLTLATLVLVITRLF